MGAGNAVGSEWHDKHRGGRQTLQEDGQPFLNFLNTVRNQSVGRFRRTSGRSLKQWDQKVFGRGDDDDHVWGKAVQFRGWRQYLLRHLPEWPDADLTP